MLTNNKHFIYSETRQEEKVLILWLGISVRQHQCLLPDTQPATQSSSSGVTVPMRSKRKFAGMWSVKLFIYAAYRLNKLESINIQSSLTVGQPISVFSLWIPINVSICSPRDTLRWMCGLTSRVCGWMHARSLQLLSGIGSGVGRCENHSISICVITERWLLHEPLQETKKPQREKRKRVSAHALPILLALMNLIRS